MRRACRLVIAGSRLSHFGPVGSGMQVKTLNQVLAIAQQAAAGLMTAAVP